MNVKKKHISENYGKLILKKKNPNGRWFDKSPQNVYGLLELSASFPESKFIHIHRNPLNVVSSLLEGKVMPVHPIKGAINYWTESMLIINEYKRAWPERVFEIAYEEFTVHPQQKTNELLTFIGEDPELLQIPKGLVHLEKNKYKKLLKPEQIEMVIERCKPFMPQYGY